MFIALPQDNKEPQFQTLTWTRPATTPGKRTTLTVGEFELSIQYPYEQELPGDIERLLKGVAKKVEDWARSSAKQ